MRRILSTVITILLSVQLFAQELPVLSDSLLRAPANKGYEYYVGTWKWEDTISKSIFIITLKIRTGKAILDTTYTYKRLIGAYIFAKDSIMSINCMDELREDKRYVVYPIYVSADIDNNMQLRVRDYLLKNGYGEFKYHGGSSSLEYVSSNPERIRWRIVDDRWVDIYWDEKTLFPSGISLPSDIILTKVED